MFGNGKVALIVLLFLVKVGYAARPADDSNMSSLLAEEQASVLSVDHRTLVMVAGDVEDWDYPITQDLGQVQVYTRVGLLVDNGHEPSGMMEVILNAKEVWVAPDLASMSTALYAVCTAFYRSGRSFDSLPKFLVRSELRDLDHEAGVEADHNQELDSVAYSLAVKLFGWSNHQTAEETKFRAVAKALGVSYQGGVRVGRGGTAKGWPADWSLSAPHSAKEIFDNVADLKKKILAHPAGQIVLVTQPSVIPWLFPAHLPSSAAEDKSDTLIFGRRKEVSTLAPAGMLAATLTVNVPGFDRQLASNRGDFDRRPLDMTNRIFDNTVREASVPFWKDVLLSEDIGDGSLPNVGGGLVRRAVFGDYGQTKQELKEMERLPKGAEFWRFYMKKSKKKKGIFKIAKDRIITLCWNPSEWVAAMSWMSPLGDKDLGYTPFEEGMEVVFHTKKVPLVGFGGVQIRVGSNTWRLTSGNPEVDQEFFEKVQWLQQKIASSPTTQRPS
mmetsp:Transcript_13165/g.30781  ORF Transcript_13165/g.30781 Transcript_13165/m.30781 type:complete len:498 (+) Transcript_13165:113-1606(+)